MRTNIVIDGDLMAEALWASGLKTKREAVEAELGLLTRRARQASAAELFGTVDWQGISTLSGAMPRLQRGAGQGCR